MKKIYIFLALLFLLPISTNASSVFRSEAVVSVTPDQVVSGDFYSLGKDSVLISGKIDGDLISSSANIGVDGLIEGEILAIAGKVEVRGKVNNSVRVIADSVLISGKIDGNVSIIARDVQILSSAEISGDVLVFGTSPFLAETSASISGFVGGNIYGHADSFRLDGKIDGVVEIKTNNLTLGDSANIPKYVKYESISELRRSPNSIVGNIVRSDPVLLNNTSNDSGDAIKSALKILLINLFAALVLFLLFRRQIERLAYLAAERPMKNFALGFAIFILIPVASTVLFFSILGVLLSFSVLLLYFLLVILSIILIGPVFGYLLSSLWNKDKKSEVSIISITVGVMAVNLTFSLLPVSLGLTFVFALFCLTLGTIAVSFYKVLRS